MLLIKYSQNELIFRTNPVVIKKINRLGMIILSLCLISFPLLLYNAEVKKLECDRLNLGQINCHLSQQKLFGFVTIQDVKIENIKEATFVNNRVFINDIYWSEYKIDQLKINKMINNVIRNKLVIISGNRFSSLLKIIILWPVLILVSLRMKKWAGNSLIFQHSEQKILQSQVNMKGEIIKEIDFAKIKNVEKTEKFKQNKQKIYQINLNLNTVNKLGFPEQIWIDNLDDEQKAQELVTILNNFIETEENM